MIKVNDVYLCIQGEGAKTGIPMALIRLQGCSVGCPFCDTKETWSTDPKGKTNVIAWDMSASPSWTELEPAGIAQATRGLVGPNIRWALLTGGEPAEQNLAELVQELHNEGFKVALETSGTADGHLQSGCDWVTVSPKVNMPGGRAIIDEVIARADELKFVIGKQADIDAMHAFINQHRPDPGTSICLLPMSASTFATGLCVEMAKRTGYRLTLQIHKLLNER